MLRSILIGLDGSNYSTAAIDLGIRWAQRSGATLIGMGIVDEPGILAPQMVALEGGQYFFEANNELVNDARQRVEGFLDEFAQRCASEGVKCRLLEEVGSPDEQILNDTKPYDLIMLGRQTYFHFETQDRPDNTLRTVLRNSSRPVVTVPENPPEGTSVVVAYNGSTEADRALQAFLGLELTDSEPVHVISIDDNPETAQRWASQASAFLRIHDVQVQSHPLAIEGSVKDTILARVRELNAHLLVMGAYGRSMWREVIFGSLTDSVLQESPVPLFLCH